jgi:hypothetical protein
LTNPVSPRAAILPTSTLPEPLAKMNDRRTWINFPERQCAGQINAMGLVDETCT